MGRLRPDEPQATRETPISATSPDLSMLSHGERLSTNADEGTCGRRERGCCHLSDHKNQEEVPRVPNPTADSSRIRITGAASLLATAAFAQATVTTTTGTTGAAVQIEPQYRTKIKSYVTEHKIRPVTTKEKIVVGGRVPADVELESVPADWGPSLTNYRYVYSGDRVMLVEPGSRTVVQEVD